MLLGEISSFPPVALYLAKRLLFVGIGGSLGEASLEQVGPVGSFGHPCQYSQLCCFGNQTGLYTYTSSFIL